MNTVDIFMHSIVRHVLLNFVAPYTHHSGLDGGADFQRPGNKPQWGAQKLLSWTHRKMWALHQL